MKFLFLQGVKILDTMKNNRENLSMFSAETLNSLAMAEVIGGVSAVENKGVCFNVKNCGDSTNKGECTNTDCSTDCDCPIAENPCNFDEDCTIINKAENCVCV